MFDRIDHVGIAVEDLDGALALFELAESTALTALTSLATSASRGVTFALICSATAA